MHKRISPVFSALLLAFTLANSICAQEKKPAIGVLIDNTISLKKQFPQVLMFGKGIVKQIHKRGPVALFNFVSKRDPEATVMHYQGDVLEGGSRDLAVAALGVEWSQDESSLSQYIDSLSVIKGNTALFEAIAFVAEIVKAKVNAERDVFGDKIIILVTDGEHRMQRLYGGPVWEEDERRKQRGQLIKKLKESGIKVYAVGLTSKLDASRMMENSAQEKAELFLKKITKETGGRVIFPKSKKIDVDVLLTELLAQ